MTQNFQKAKIYKITNDYNDEIYIGSTCDTLIKRFLAHKSSSKKDVDKNRPIYKLMNEIGFERFRIDLIEDYPCNDKQALRQREGHFIRELGTLNMCVAGRAKKEWFEMNADKVKEYQKNYYDTNKEELNKVNKEYYEKNKEDVLKKNKEYRTKHKEEIKERKKDYSLKNAEKNKERCREWWCNNKEKIKEYNKKRYEKKKLENKNISIK